LGEEKARIEWIVAWEGREVEEGELEWSDARRRRRGRGR
jgi:hypothetical protein